MTWGEYLFSFKGRINRARYWAFAGLGALYLIVAIAIASVGVVGPAKSGDKGIVALFGLALAASFIVFYFAQLAITAKRLHDRNKSAWWIILFIVVPLVFQVFGFATLKSDASASAGFRGIAFLISIWAFVELGCLRGTDGPNDYGPDPLQAPRDTAAVFS